MRRWQRIFWSFCNCIWEDDRIFLRCDPVTIVTGFLKKKRFYLSICIFCNWFWEKNYNFFTLEILKQLIWWNDIRFFQMEFWTCIFLAEKSCSNFFYLEKLVRDFFMGFRDYEHEGVAFSWNSLSLKNISWNQGYPFMFIITEPHEKIPDTFFQVKKIGTRFLGQKKSRPNLLENIITSIDHCTTSPSP